MLKIADGKRLYNFIDFTIKVADCDKEFEAAGTEQTSLDCYCHYQGKK